MNILDQIIEFKRKEVTERKLLVPVKQVEQSKYFSAPTRSLTEHLTAKGKSGIIAEIKRKSPSKGVINSDVSIEKIATGYTLAGASAISVLTDNEFFDGSNDDLMTARKFTTCPILRKEFVIDEYQIAEAKSIGADAILLIAAVLLPAEVKRFSHYAHELGLEVLMEVHNEEELKQNLDAGVDLIGVNNRNLKTFELSIETSKRLAAMIPDSVTKVSESGIESPGAIVELKRFGYKGFLIGQTFMQNTRPEEAAMEFIKELRRVESEKLKA